MYSTINLYPAIFIFILYLLLLCIHPSSPVTMNVSDQMVDTICRLTLNYDYCTTILKIHPRTPMADMNELAMIAVIEATSQARMNKFVLSILQNNETDPITKSCLRDCVSDYTVTLGKLSMASRLFDTKDYKGVDRWANDAMKMTTKCETRFLKPPTRPSPIHNYSQQMIWANSIVLAILKILLESG